jgi:hypothetical protein
MWFNFPVVHSVQKAIVVDVWCFPLTKVTDLAAPQYICIKGTLGLSPAALVALQIGRGEFHTF